MSGLLLILAWPVTGDGFVSALPAVTPVWLGILCTIIILGRELIISAFRQIAATKKLVLAADKSGKIKAAFQDVTIFLYMIYAFLVVEFYPSIQGTANTVLNVILIILLAITTILTITSGIGYIVKNFHVLKEKPQPAEDVQFDLIIPDVMAEFIDEGVISADKIASRFNLDDNRAQKIIQDMTDLGYISSDGDEREIMISEKEFKQIFRN